MANRSGVQAKRVFFDHRRDFWRLNILNSKVARIPAIPPKVPSLQYVGSVGQRRMIRFHVFTAVRENAQFFQEKRLFLAAWPNGGKNLVCPQPWPGEAAVEGGRHVNSCPSRTPRR